MYKYHVKRLQFHSTKKLHLIQIKAIFLNQNQCCSSRRAEGPEGLEGPDTENKGDDLPPSYPAVLVVNSRFLAGPIFE